MLVTLEGRSFQAAVPQLWNTLPSRPREVTSVETFKKNLKTFLFKKAFTDRFALIKLTNVHFLFFKLYSTKLKRKSLLFSSSLRPGSKAFTGENNLLYSYISKSIDGNGTRFSTQLHFNVLNILKYNWYF